LGAALVVLLVFAGKTAFSQGILAQGKPDAILTDSLNGPCDPELGQADLVPGTDVNGNPVAPADLESAPLPFKGQIAVPLKGKPGRAPAYVTVDGSKLDPLLGPQSSCK
jgi:hypothetical protein